MISPDGRYVLFTSYATDLVSIADNNNRTDVFVRDMNTATNQRVSLGIGAAELGEDSYALGMSADARRILFATHARVVPQDTNALWDIYMYDRQQNQTTLVSSNASGLAVGTPESAGPPWAAISESGIHVVFATDASLNVRDTNPGTDVYWKDVTTGITKLASTKADGRVVDNFNSDLATISGDGRYVAFDTTAPLVPADTNGTRDVYVKDIAFDGITRVTTRTGGAQVADTRCQSLSLSGNGNVVSMMCESNELVSDTQGQFHIYTKARDTDVTTLISRAAGGAIGNGANPYSIVSKGGSRLAITAKSSNFVTPDTNAVYDVFIASRQ
jgi:Tol biopolymer transport system component